LRFTFETALRIFNDWLRSFCAHYPDRLLGLANIPCHTPAMALEEAHRIVKIGGLRGLDMAAASPAAKPYYHPDWDPFWAFASEAGMQVHFHTFGPELPEDAMDSSDDIFEGPSGARTCGAAGTWQIVGRNGLWNRFLR
jgi:uncharacterized protein